MPKRKEVLRCSAHAVPVFCVVQTIELARLTGVLEVGVCTASFVQGAPVAATVGRHHGIAALLELFLVEDGQASFYEESVSGSPLGDSIGLQIEGCRLSDEWHRLRGYVLDGKHAAGLPDPLKAALNGRQTLAEALMASGLLWAQVCDALVASMEDGSVSLQTSPPAREAPTFDDWISQGRRALKQRDFDTALQAFESALALDATSTVASQNLRRAEDLKAQWSELT